MRVVVVVVRERAVTKERLGVVLPWYQAKPCQLAILQSSNKRSREERGKNDGRRMKRCESQANSARPAVLRSRLTQRQT
jgi:hypothetical protein